jgi:hypothetical protein
LLIRRQHPKFGEEIRALLASARSEDQEIAGIVISELNKLTQLRAQGERHPKEDKLVGSTSALDYLRLYSHGYSIRVYYFINHGTIWMLAVDKNKRTTKMSESTQTILISRLADIYPAQPTGRHL